MPELYSELEYIVGPNLSKSHKIVLKVARVLSPQIACNAFQYIVTNEELEITSANFLVDPRWVIVHQDSRPSQT